MPLGLGCTSAERGRFYHSGVFTAHHSELKRRRVGMSQGSALSTRLPPIPCADRQPRPLCCGFRSVPLLGRCWKCSRSLAQSRGQELLFNLCIGNPLIHGVLRWCLRGTAPDPHLSCALPSQKFALSSSSPATHVLGFANGSPSPCTSTERCVG